MYFSLLPQKRLSLVFGTYDWYYEYCVGVSHTRKGAMMGASHTRWVRAKKESRPNCSCLQRHLLRSKSYEVLVRGTDSNTLCLKTAVTQQLLLLLILTSVYLQQKNIVRDISLVFLLVCFLEIIEFSLYITKVETKVVKKKEATARDIYLVLIVF